MPNCSRALRDNSEAARLVAIVPAGGGDGGDGQHVSQDLRNLKDLTGQLLLLLTGSKVKTTELHCQSEVWTHPTNSMSIILLTIDCAVSHLKCQNYV